MSLHSIILFQIGDHPGIHSYRTTEHMITNSQHLLILNHTTTIQTHHWTNLIHCQIYNSKRKSKHKIPQFINWQPPKLKKSHSGQLFPKLSGACYAITSMPHTQQTGHCYFAYLSLHNEVWDKWAADSSSSKQIFSYKRKLLVLEIRIMHKSN